ncbi:hypothetical protein SMMN14_09134 [Sphaerulina musiva]
MASSLTPECKSLSALTFNNINNKKSTLTAVYSNEALPPIQSLTHDLIRCPSCSHMCSDRTQLQRHLTQSGCQGPLQAQSQRPEQRGLRHDSMHSIHSVAHSPRSWAAIPDQLHNQLPSSSSSAASDSDGICYTPDVSRASSVSHDVNGSRRTSHVDVTASKRPRRQPTGSPVLKRNKKAKKTEKEQLNRSNQGAVMFRMEDSLAHNIRWSKDEQSGGNGNSAGLFSNKINLLRTWEAVTNHALHKARCDAIRSGTLADFEREYQAVADGACEETYQPYAGTFLQLAPGETLCRHEDTKSKECSEHNNPDWRDCRKGRADVRFSRNENSYLAALGITKQQALYGGSRAAVALPTIYGGCGGPPQQQQQLHHARN